MVDILISQKNLGFARGNNLGCKHAIKLYNPEFLLVINNDTYIKQPEFLDEIEKEYSIEKFHILGPYIYEKNLLPQNPQLNLKVSLKEVEKEIFVNESLLNKYKKSPVLEKTKIKRYYKK